MSKHEFLKADKSVDPPIFHIAQTWGLQPKIPMYRLKLELAFEEDSLFKFFRWYRPIVCLAYFHCYLGESHFHSGITRFSLRHSCYAKHGKKPSFFPVSYRFQLHLCKSSINQFNLNDINVLVEIRFMGLADGCS